MTTNCPYKNIPQVLMSHRDQAHISLRLVVIGNQSTKSTSTRTLNLNALTCFIVYIHIHVHLIWGCGGGWWSKSRRVPFQLPHVNRGGFIALPPSITRKRSPGWVINPAGFRGVLVVMSKGTFGCRIAVSINRGHMECVGFAFGASEAHIVTGYQG